MLLDNEPKYHADIIAFTKAKFNTCFNKDITLEKETFSEGGYGYFLLEYNYYPKDYRVVFEHDRLYFGITIFDKDNAFASLQREIKTEIPSYLDKKNIEVAIEALREVLLHQNVVFYVSKDDKLYKKVDGNLVRIKDKYSIFKNS